MIEKYLECFSLPLEMNFMISVAAADDSVSLDIDNMDWKRFKELISQNRVEPLIAAKIKKIPQDRIQKNVILSDIICSKNQYTLFSMRQIQTLASVMSDFASCGIRALSVKGPLLAMELYGNPEMRYSHDLDILVSKSDFSKACERLETCGFHEMITAINKTPKRRRIQEKHQGIVHREYFQGDICIELHWKISHRWDESFDVLWERRSQKTLLGQSISCLGELDNLSYLICHAAAHGYLRMRWLFDLRILLCSPVVDWIALYENMTQKGIQEMLIETLLLLYRCPAFEMPPIKNSLFSMSRENEMVQVQFSENLESDYKHAVVLSETIWPMMLMTETERKNSSQIRKYNSMLPIAGKKQSHFEVLLSFFRPAPVDLERFDFPDSLYFLYYIIRPFYRLWRMTPFYRP